MKVNIKKLTTSGILIALATILSFLTVYHLPYGGSITPVSMLPIVVIAYLFGIKWGLLSGLIYGAIQAVLGATVTSAFAGQNIWAVFGILFFDYVVAFSILGIAGMFKGKIKNDNLAFALGTLIATILRYISHIISGVIFFGSYAEWFFTQETTASFGPKILGSYTGLKLSVIYSVIYNGTFMIPEIIMTTVAAALVANLIVLLGKKFIERK